MICSKSTQEPGVPECVDCLNVQAKGGRCQACWERMRRYDDIVNDAVTSAEDGQQRVPSVAVGANMSSSTLHLQQDISSVSDHGLPTVSPTLLATLQPQTRHDRSEVYCCVNTIVRCCFLH